MCSHQDFECSSIVADSLILLRGPSPKGSQESAYGGKDDGFILKNVVVQLL